MSLEEKRRREWQRRERLRQRQPKTDDFPGTGVVLSDGIRFYCKQFDLIAPFEEENLKPANYQLCGGDEYAVGGVPGTLIDSLGSDELEIPSFEVAVIKTLETINMPRFLIGRWNIRVPRAYEGLLWVGGPQVDAGYVGNLFCPIYNLSDKPVKLRYKDPFAIIDFVKTTAVHTESKPYMPKTTWLILEDYPKLQSALVTQVTGRLGEFATRVENLQRSSAEQAEKLDARINRFGAATLTLIAVLFAALAVFVTSHAPTAVTIWTYFSVALAVLAIVIALGARRGD